jgi:glycosyltransferase involved in cell wall biosynthesis
VKDTPLISIITPSFNQANFIGDALESVCGQSYKNWEHLVIDGRSTDGTIDLLQYESTKSGRCKMSWVSERDTGQSEALNKGFRRATGEIIGWLNSDDRYRPDCFEHVVKAFRENPNADVIYGDYSIVDEAGAVLKIRREIEFNAFILRYHHVLYIPTTATFFRSRIFAEDNWLNERLQYAMDLEFFMRLSERGYRFKHIPHLLADFRMQPDSKTCRAPDQQRMEHRQVVCAAAPILRHTRYPGIKTFVLTCLCLIARFRRYSEKLLKGYYWEHLRSE